MASGQRKRTRVDQEEPGRKNEKRKGSKPQDYIKKNCKAS